MSQHWNPPENRARSELGDEFDKLRVSTKILRTHPPAVSDDVDPIAVSIYPSATYRLNSVQHYLDILNEGGYFYQRLGNPTVQSAEIIINELEEGTGTILFASGMAAITSVFLSFLKAGDHLIYPNPCYSATLSFIRRTLEKFGVVTDTVKGGADVKEYEKLIKPNTKTPLNPTMAITDLEALGALGKSNPGIITVIDGTFASPYLQKALKFGINISIHSCTKYMGGHSDMVGGAVTVDSVQLWKQLKVYTASTGALLAPFDSYLLQRGLRTLPLRMDRHSSNAMAVATFLQDHPKVKKVWYPGLPSHPQHAVADKQMTNFSGVLSFEVGGLEEAKRVVESVRVINLAVSLGGVESLIEHPASMTHGSMLMSDEERSEGGITDGLIRLSVGLEDHKDLIKDLEQALNSC